MKIARKAAFAPRTRALADEMAAINNPCVGCTDCQGMCQALIDTLLLPEIVLKQEHNA